ncbi:glycosyltransferase family 2 protein [Aestuariivirga litoralis]|uniref:glycosyltransferase family 2 protein n=1 Tax=Aestuariivirga litoralis TaxID=2650924 RepID=UPI0018C7F554|nr:glycosyltransferase family 2 protein [Aestuariivirga litoralis]MBG1232198.1 glycosyltransferase family 2 protein [Aestuariivirga litoralis]
MRKSVPIVPRRRATDRPAPLLSLIVPMFNEEEGVEGFFARLIPILRKVTEDYEVVCIDDGSSDRTLPALEQQHAKDARIKVLSLSRNFGKDISLSAGLDYARGRAVIPIDADLQDPPELIPEMVAKWREGFDVVYARRISRDVDDTQKRLSANWFYRIHNWIADVRIPDNVGDYRLMDRRVVSALQALPEKTRFMKGLFAWVGFKQTGIDYSREARAAGTTKWRYWKLWNFALDGLTASSTMPLRIWTYFGVALGLFSIFYALWLVLRTALYGNPVPGYASLMVTVLILGSINIIATGILGEYVGRIYNEVRNRPLYLVRESLGLEPATPKMEQR